jgi:hypothetical protein
MGYRRAEPKGIQRESSQLLAKVFKGLREDGIRATNIAEAIGISANELRSHVFGLTLTSVPAVAAD